MEVRCARLSSVIANILATKFKKLSLLLSNLFLSFQKDQLIESELTLAKLVGFSFQRYFRLDWPAGISHKLPLTILYCLIIVFKFAVTPSKGDLIKVSAFILFPSLWFQEFRNLHNTPGQIYILQTINTWMRSFLFRAREPLINSRRR